MPAMRLVYLEESPYKAWKGQIAAQFSGIKLESKPYNEKQDQVAMSHNPWMRLPYLEMETGVVANSNAIARYIGKLRPDKELFGASFSDSCTVDGWMEFCTREIEIPAGVLVFAHKKLIDVPAPAIAKATTDLQNALVLVDRSLAGRQFLVGQETTLADISVVCALVDVMPIFPAVSGCPNLLTWFKRCAASPHFATVLPKDTVSKVPKAGAVSKPVAVAAPPKAADKPKASAPAAATIPAATATAVTATAGLKGTPEEQQQLQAAKDKVRDLKTAKADADSITAAVAEMKRLKDVCGEVDPPKKKKK